MALVWQHHAGNKHYEVRKAGESLRLYTNGVFHSQFNPRRPLGGHLWDLLFLPVRLISKPAADQRILLLGVGGGAVIKALRTLHHCQCEITGVDLDAVHLEIARKFFAVEFNHTQLHCADAVGWVKAYRGPPFDVVIDDLFGEDGASAQRPQRAVPVTADWLCALKGVLAPGGVVAFNVEGSGAASRLHRLVAQEAHTHPFRRMVRFSLPRYDNVVAALLTEPVSRRGALERLSQHRTLERALKNPAYDLIYRFSRLD